MANTPVVVGSQDNYEPSKLNPEEIQYIEKQTADLISIQPPPPFIPQDLLSQFGSNAVNEGMKKAAAQKALAENIKNTLIHLENNKKIIEKMNKKFTEVISEPDIEKQITQLKEIRDTLKNMIDKNKLYASVQDIEDIKTKNKENIADYGSIMAKVVLKMIELEKKQKEIQSKKEQEEAMRQKSKVDYENAVRTLEATIIEKNDEINRTIEEINKQKYDSYKYVDGDTLEDIINKIQQLNNVIQKLTAESTQLESSYSNINIQLQTVGKNNDQDYKKAKGIDNVDPTMKNAKLYIKEAELYNEELKLEQSKIEDFEQRYKEVSVQIEENQQKVTKMNKQIEDIKSSEDDDKTKEERITNGLKRLIKQENIITNFYETIKTLAETNKYTKANDRIKAMEDKSNAAKALVDEVKAYLAKLRESNQTKQQSTIRTVNFVGKSTGEEDDDDETVVYRRHAWNKPIQQRQSKDTQDVSPFLETLNNFLKDTKNLKDIIGEIGVTIADEATPLKDAETALENIKRQYESIKLKNKQYKTTAQSFISDERINNALEKIQTSIDDIAYRVETAQYSINERRSKKNSLFTTRDIRGTNPKSDELLVEDFEENSSVPTIRGKSLQGLNTSTDEDYDEIDRMLQPEFKKTKKEEEARYQAYQQEQTDKKNIRIQQKKLNRTGVSNSKKEAAGLLLNNDYKTARLGGGKKTKKQRDKKNKTKKRHT
jgi:hypothetical protein